jgi:hypothetical protein
MGILRALFMERVATCLPNAQMAAFHHVAELTAEAASRSLLLFPLTRASDCV